MNSEKSGLSRKIVGPVLVICVLGLLVPMVVGALVSHRTQTDNLQVVREFIENNGDELEKMDDSIIELGCYTGQGGRLFVIHRPGINKDVIENFVLTKSEGRVHVYYSVISGN